MRFGNSYAGRRVLITGHTGFKGSWLAEWLLSLGARVTGLALAPENDKSLFEQLGLEGRIDHHIGDIRDAAVVARTMQAVRPEYVFHLAAQSLVRRSYQIPSETYAVNVMGSINVMEALRDLDAQCSVVMVTTDKCYENREQAEGYVETDPLGGADPYSSSKAAAEIAIGSWRQSFFKDHPVSIASARAGNVIGGGDWAEDRIIPDSMRALQLGQRINLRNRNSTRPWQHVLEPLSGYLQLGEHMDTAHRSGDRAALLRLGSAFNFGPPPGSTRTVGDLVETVLDVWPGEWTDATELNAPHEAKLLSLSTAKAEGELGWTPVWDFETTVARTVGWYREANEGRNAQELTLADIAAYTKCDRP